MTTSLKYYLPKTADEVSGILFDYGFKAKIMAGGTDLVVQLNSGTLDAACIIDINPIEELGVIRDLPDGGMRIGATVRLSELIRHPKIRSEYQALWDGAFTVGSVQIRNRATLVGNICNASPAADTAPGLLVHGATVNIQGPSRIRSVPLAELFSCPGQTTLEKGEWVTSIDLSPARKYGACYLKLGRTQGVDLALVGVATLLEEAEMRVAFSSVAPTPILAPAVGKIYTPEITEAEFKTQVGETIEATLKPIDDIRASAEYRMEMAKVLIVRAWRLATSRYIEWADSEIVYDR